MYMSMSLFLLLFCKHISHTCKIIITILASPLLFNLSVVSQTIYIFYYIYMYVYDTIYTSNERRRARFRNIRHTQRPTSESPTLDQPRN
jgi:hypothetical protein